MDKETLTAIAAAELSKVELKDNPADFGFFSPESLDGKVRTSGMRHCCINVAAEYVFRNSYKPDVGDALLCGRGHLAAIYEGAQWRALVIPSRDTRTRWERFRNKPIPKDDAWSEPVRIVNPK